MSSNSWCDSCITEGAYSSGIWTFINTNLPIFLNFYKHKFTNFTITRIRKVASKQNTNMTFFRLTIDSVIWQWYSVTLPLCIRIISLQQRNQFGITRSIFAIVNTVYTLHDNRIGFARSPVSHKFAPKDSIKPCSA